MASIEEAEEIVHRLTTKYGYLREEIMSDMKPEYRRELKENWLAMENAAAHSTKTLAKQIYGSDARFVFELLQNAEDNKFFKATEDPYISFKVYANRIIVECNEDGFTERDLEAICAVGQSTKSSSYGYIGAKGIGFKSVFIAAWKVHIQSGNFSFEFRHKRDDPGLGMVRPIWVPTDERLEGPLTRMTLYLHDEGDPDELQRLKLIIFKQLGDLQQTCLLFLKTIQRIKVAFYDKDGRVERSKEFLKRKVDNYRVALDTKSTKDNETRKESQIYHTTALKAHGLARSDNRDPPNTDVAETISTSAEVVLAFPLTAQFEPLVNTKKKQEIFAFLPVRESDYKFLIHSDFDTSANRQDIITTSTRNENLLEWIAKAFLNAVKQFCEHDILCYEWPLFLPTTGGASNTFWAELDVKIRKLVMEIPTLKSRSRRDLRLITDVRILTKDATYGEGEPIFDNPVKDPFLSQEYSGPVKKVLEGYGLQYSSAPFFFSMLIIDLSSSNSRMRGTEMTEDWHSAVANFFCSWFDRQIPWALELKRLPLIPLRDGKWTSTASKSVYFSTTKGVAIPERLGIKVIQSTATSNTARKRLYKHLGVSEADVATVRALILRAYFLGQYGTPSDVKSYLHYLYLTHRPGISATTELAEVRVEVEKGDSCRHAFRPHETDIYLCGRTHPFSPETLLAPDGAAPGFSAAFIHTMHMEDIPRKPAPDHPSWERWLLDFVGIREQLRLVNHSGESLSEEVMYVHQHRSERFLGLLEHLWRDASPEVRRNQILRRTIKALSAKNLCGVSYTISLGDTWLPVENLRDHVSLYLELPQHFPFLKIDSTDPADEFGVKWSFLAECFDVKKDENLVFYMDMLRYIQNSHPRAVLVRQGQKIFDLCDAIYAKITLSRNKSQDQLTIQNFFTEARIFVPGAKNSIWAPSSDCLWLAPPGMLSKHSLRSLYSKTIGGDQLENIERLFHKIVKIPSASWSDIVTELETLKNTSCDDFERIKQLYGYLGKIKPPETLLKDVFATKQLIYAKSRGKWRWCKISDCLWSSPIEIRIGNTTSNTGTGFGNFGATITLGPGTAIAPFQAFMEKEPYSNINQSNAFQNILFQDPYKKWSTDELRLADYVKGRRHDNPSGSGAFGVGSGFDGGGLFKVILDSDYEELKDFFVGMLGVTSLTVQMLYDELKQTSSQRDINDVKVAILSLSSLLQTSTVPLDPQPILDNANFPVRSCNGEIALQSAKLDFAIPDRDYLSDMFEEKIAMLDFDLENIHRLKPFFEWTKLQGRYLSSCVVEGTSVSEKGRPISVKHRDLKRKAYYFLRIAATFGSTRYLADPSGFYQLLRTMNTMETTRISSTLTVSQNNQEFSVENVIGNEHIEHTSSGLTIFVPQKRNAQTVCYNSALPSKFAEWIMRDPTTQIPGTVESEMVRSLIAVLTCDCCDRSVLSDICSLNGIVQVDIPNEDIEDDEEEEEGSEDDTEDDDDDEEVDVDDEEEVDVDEEEEVDVDEEEEVDVNDEEEEVEVDEEEEVEVDEEEEVDVDEEEEVDVDDEEEFDVDEEEEVDVDEEDDADEEDDNNELEQQQGQRTPYTDTPESDSETLVETVVRRNHLSSQPPPYDQGQQDIPSYQRRPFVPPGPSNDHGSPLASVESRENLASAGPSADTQYGALLERVIAAAQSATFPSQGTFDMSDLRNSLPGQLSDDTFESFDGLGIATRFRSANQLERDKKVGAAGELFVFELLSTLELPHWSNENWQSTIRSYVRAHPNYRNITSWRGRETADLVYDDTGGELTNTLIGCGYLDQDEWHNARPKYYIEVKTTTGPRETPFYMSNSQYERMRRTHATPDRSEIYMVLRVFWLNSDNIGMCVYFDPEQLRQDGRLIFTAQTWSVTPAVESED